MKKLMISFLTGCSVIEVKLKDNPQEPQPSEGGCPCWQKKLHSTLHQNSFVCFSTLLYARTIC